MYLDGTSSYGYQVYHDEASGTFGLAHGLQWITIEASEATVLREAFGNFHCRGYIGR